MIYKQGDIKDLYKGNIKAKEFYKGSQLLYSADKSLVLLDGANNYAEFEVAATDRAGDPYVEMAVDALKFIRQGYSSSSYPPGTMATKNAIDLTKYSKLFIDWKKENSSNPISQYVVAGYRDVRTHTLPLPFYSPTSQNLFYGQTFSRQITEVNISAATGSNYIIIGNAVRETATLTSTLTIYKIWLE